VLASNDDGTITLAASAFANLGITLGGVAITVVGIAAYALLRDRGDALAEVFA
jgi:hypothetical protein